MKNLMVTILTVVIFLSVIPAFTYGQDSNEVVTLSPKVGDTIDVSERDYYDLFQTVKNFSSAVILRQPDGKFIARITVVVSSGPEILSMEYSEALIYQYAEKIEHFNELKAGTYVMGTNRPSIIINGKNVLWQPTPQTSQAGHSGRNDTKKNSVQNVFETNNTSQAFFLGGGGIGGSSEGISVGGNFSYRSGHNLISLRFVHNQELNLFSRAAPETAWDIGVLYGICLGYSYGFVSVQGGLSIVGGSREKGLISSGGYFTSDPYKNTNRTFTTIGIPVASQLFWTPGSNFGIGVCAFADWNREKSFYGGLLCFQIGSANYRSIHL